MLAHMQTIRPPAAPSPSYELVADRFAAAIDNRDPVPGEVTQYARTVRQDWDIPTVLAAYILHRRRGKATYRRIARELLDVTGVDISYEAVRRWYHAIKSAS